MAKRFIDAELLKKNIRVNLMPSVERYFLNLIDKTSTADVVKVRHGEWIWVEDGVDDYEQYWVCSVCKEKTYFETKFCSECGAKMDKEVTK